MPVRASSERTATVHGDWVALAPWAAATPLFAHRPMSGPLAQLVLVETSLLSSPDEAFPAFRQHRAE